MIRNEQKIGKISQNWFFERLIKLIIFKKTNQEIKTK